MPVPVPFRTHDLAVGSLTLRPLLLSSAPSRLISLIRTLTSPSFPSVHAAKLLPPVLRALRNLLVSTADLVWGHMWGVGAERRVVATGLVGMDLNEEHEAAGVAGAAGQGKGKGVAGKGEAWKGQASSALGLVFEVSAGVRVHRRNLL
jgi:hypothetical protein